MLIHLSIRNIVLIRALDLNLQHGLSVLTGETGAGKSILLDALGLALGSRADFNLIGSNSNSAEVSAVFHVNSNHPAVELLTASDIPHDGNEIIIRRQLRDGKSLAMINDTPVSLTLLRQVGDTLAEIQGQFEGRGLLDTSTHRHLLDRYAKTETLKTETAAAYQHWQNADAALKEALSMLEKARNDEEWLTDAVSQLDALMPQIGEEENLLQEQKTFANANKIAEALALVDHCINDEGGMASITATASKNVERTLDQGSKLLAPLYETLGRIEAEINEAASLTLKAQDALETDPNYLQVIEDRLHALRGQARKHDVTLDELPQIHEKLIKKLSDLDHHADTIADLTAKEAEAAKDYEDKAQKLSIRRRNAAQTLDEKVMAELPPLKLDKARFSTVVKTLNPEHWTRHGMDQVYFTASTNHNSNAMPLERIASGGELMRFLLALKVVLAATNAPITLIFDEVDSGVGGSVAAAVGERLARLGMQTQCLVITHSPQVAAQGANHLRITKTQEENNTLSHAHVLNADERLEEISRMLSGTSITQEARAAARRLLEKA